MVKKTLGRGLEALIPSGPAEPTGEGGYGEVEVIYQLPLDQIYANRLQPRQDFDESTIEGLAASINSSGILQPVVVQKTSQGYELIAGERRMRAAKKAGWQTIPAILTQVDEKERLQLALIENIQREDLNSMEEALAYQNLIQIANYTQEELSGVVGKERSTISNSLRLLKLPAEIQQHLRAGEISSGHARALLSLGSSQEQIELCQLIIAKGLSVRQVEECVRGDVKLPKKKADKPSKPPLDVMLQSIQDQLAQRFVTRVKINPAAKGGGGKIVIDYYSVEDLERIIQSIKAD